MTNKPRLRLHDVRKSYFLRPVLQGVDLHVDPGSIVGLLGPNGAGKSTLIEIILGLLKADAGEVETLGELPWSLSASAKARLGYVPQKAEYPRWMHVFEMVDYVSSFYGTWNPDMVDSLLQQWAIDPESPLATLSGGEAQKLAIVLALGPQPDLLVLDEPAAELDPRGRHELGRLLRDYVGQSGRSVLFSTHIVSDVERVADEVAILYGGTVRYRGSVGELVEWGRRETNESSATLEDAYLHATA